ncbi:Clavaminate synthase-like protein [Rhizodiscina lignyota]|uniref:Clavaminate synthase-like protein n=1 Tax=Rhizodiscina lignyota TaxID=1504668 RepID=A0A9P4IP80_9PEZI|nr:Clavaminate synthase-like protein [Rhizodiscina lignyota]
MAPSAIATVTETGPEYVTFHAAKGRGKRLVLKGDKMKDTFETIPTVDFTKAFSSSLEDRKSVAKEVGDAFRNVGFLYAKGHGIPEDLQERTKEAVKQFFALPTEEKVKLHINNSPAIMGYEALLETKLDETTRGDLKEAFLMGTDPKDPEQDAPKDLDPEIYPPGQVRNQWPPVELLPEFRKTIYEYRNALLAFSKTLVHMIALALDLDELYLDKYLRYPHSSCRLLRYPPQEVSNDVGIGAHADYTWFTLVNQLTPDPALEVLNANAHWVSAVPVPNTLVVNVGDFLERATNDEFVSTVHRVVNKTGKERYSLPFFLTPTMDTMVETFPTCWGPDRPKKYEDISADQWQKMRLYSARYKHPASIAARKAGKVAYDTNTQANGK